MVVYFFKISRLLNCNVCLRELLEKVDAWEKGEDQPFAARRPEKLEPLINEGSQGPIHLLREQNDSLRQENSVHLNTIHELQAQV